MAKKSDKQRVVFSTRLDPVLLKKIRHLAVDEGKALNVVLEDAIKLLLSSKK